MLPPDIPRPSAIRVDAPVLLVSSVVAALATLVFGSIAAIKGRAAANLSSVARASGDTRSTARAGGGVLVVTEIALALALSVVAMLMLHRARSRRPRRRRAGVHCSGIACRRLRRRSFAAALEETANKLRQELTGARTTIAAMERSLFWRARLLMVRLRQMFRLGR